MRERTSEQSRAGCSLGLAPHGLVAIRASPGEHNGPYDCYGFFAGMVTATAATHFQEPLILTHVSIVRSR